MNPRPPLSLIFLPTLNCDADCEYCFEKKGAPPLDLEKLPELFGKVFSHMDDHNFQELHVHWQGGEILTLTPEWLQKAEDSIQLTASLAHKEVVHFLQSNLIGYGPEWEPVIADMFGYDIGSSVDYPNRHRKVKGGSPEAFNALWLQKANAARKAGYHLGVIAIPSEETLDAGAAAFYRYFTETLALEDFQLNAPFAAGPSHTVKEKFPLNPQKLGRFYTELIDIWMAEGYENGIRIGPFDQLLSCFLGEPHQLPCIWHRNCAEQFICIHPKGHLAQCDCWAASYPEYYFGNIFEDASLSDILKNSDARKRFLDRPAHIIQNEDCIECPYLAICHGGCPVRAYSVRGKLFDKDPYCPAYLSVFRHMESVAGQMARDRSS